MKTKYILIFYFALLCGMANAQSWSFNTTFPGVRPDQRISGVSASVGINAYFGLGVSLYTPYIFFNDFWQYNTATRIWTQLPDFPGSGRYDAVSFVIGTNIYVGTGDTAWKNADLNMGTYHNEFYVFNTLSNTWSLTTNFPISIGEAVAFTINGKGYVIGGRDSNSSYNNKLYCFDPLTSIWTRKTDLPAVGRSYPIGFSANGNGYVGGGYMGGWVLSNGLTPKLFNDFWQYNPITDSWVSKGQTYNGGNENTGKIAEAISISTCNRGYIISGRFTGAFTSPINTSVSEYNPDTNSWTLKASLPSSIPNGNLDSGSGWFINGSLYAGQGNNAAIYSLNLYDISFSASPICTTSTLTLQNQPANSSVSWSSGNTSGLVINPNIGIGVATIQGNFLGKVTVTATVTITSCSFTVDKSIWVGKPDKPGSVNGNTSPNIGYTESYSSSAPGNGATSYDWILPYNSQGCVNCWSMYSVDSPLSIRAIVGSASGWVQAVSRNDCGPGGASKLRVFPTGDPGCNPCQIVINPNPNPTDKELHIGTGDGKKEVILFNSTQERVFDLITSEHSITIPTTTLPEGIYYLHIISEGKKIMNTELLLNINDGVSS